MTLIAVSHCILNDRKCSPNQTLICATLVLYNYVIWFKLHFSTCHFCLSSLFHCLAVYSANWSDKLGTTLLSAVFVHDLFRVWLYLHHWWCLVCYSAVVIMVLFCELAWKFPRLTRTIVVCKFSYFMILPTLFWQHSLTLWHCSDVSNILWKCSASDKVT